MRRRFALTVLAVTTMVTLSFSIPLAVVVRTVAADQALIAADQEAQSLAGALGASASQSALVTFVDQLNATSARRATAVLPGGQRIGAATTVPKDDLTVATSGRAFTAVSGEQTYVFAPVRLSSGAVSVAIVGVPGSMLRHGVTLAWLILGVVSVLIVVLAVALADRLGRSLVASVRALGAVTRRLQRGELEARVAPHGPPEVREVGETVNSLAARIVEMLAHERETAADLSHRLRTPLMALQLDAEAVASETERARLLDDVAALSAAVNDAIRAARREASREVGAADLSAVVAERLAFWSVLAEEQERAVEADLSERALVVGVGWEELAAAVDALLTNVFAHTPEQAGFRVATSASGRGGELLVEDHGGGFPSQLAVERGKSGTGSTGLGLDIVERTARTSGGGVTLGRSRNGGASVRVHFGPPAR